MTQLNIWDSAVDQTDEGMPQFPTIYWYIYRGSLSSQWEQTLFLVLCPDNERRRYFVTTSLIGWAQA